MNQVKIEIKGPAEGKDDVDNFFDTLEKVITALTQKNDRITNTKFN